MRDETQAHNLRAHGFEPVTGDLSHLDRVIRHTGPFERLTFDEAVEVLNGDPRWVRAEGGWRVRAVLPA